MSTESKAVREWARAHGFTVGDRGRFSRQVLDAYAAAHGAGAVERAAAAPVVEARESVTVDGQEVPF